MHGQAFPPGVQVAENLHAKGLVDAVVPPGEVAEVAARVLDVLCAPREVPPAVEPVPDDHVEDIPVAESVRRSRRPDRPGVRALLKAAARDVTPLSGTAAGEMDPGVLVALARSSARTGTASGGTSRWDRRDCARRAAASASPGSSTSRW
jgi:acetyl-CoA carboxylase carboxyl transferase subunit beta